MKTVNLRGNCTQHWVRVERVGRVAGCKGYYFNSLLTCYR